VDKKRLEEGGKKERERRGGEREREIERTLFIIKGQLEPIFIFNPPSPHYL
jgi:hypothetical protein